MASRNKTLAVCMIINPGISLCLGYFHRIEICFISKLFHLGLVQNFLFFYRTFFYRELFLNLILI